MPCCSRISRLPENGVSGSDLKRVEPPATPSGPPASCWFSTPNGCRYKRGRAAGKWKRDTWGEKHRNAGYDMEACEKRAKDYSRWCGRPGAETFHIPPPPMAPAPSKPKGSCWYATPKGCPRNKRLMANPKWKRDKWGEKYRNAKYDASACARGQARYARWCGVKSDDIESSFVPPKEVKAAPITPAGSCWYSTPKGCPRNPKAMALPSWKRDVYGEKYRNAKYSPTACAKRGDTISAFCGLKKGDVNTSFNPPPPASAPPTTPHKCYYLTPNGCPRHPTAAAVSKWKHDKWGAAFRNSDWDHKACERRQRDYTRWCGAQALTQHNGVPVPDPPIAPEGSCWFNTPNGCRRHKKAIHDKDWARDKWGEKYRNAALSPTACALRARDYARWCGVRKVLTHHVDIPTVDHPKAPKKSCWYYTPSGCPRHPRAAAVRKWKLDNWGMKRGAGKSDAICKRRQRDYRRWCGINDVQTHRVKNGPRKFKLKTPKISEKSSIKVKKHKKHPKGLKHAGKLPKNDGCCTSKQILKQQLP
eukprot:NODE_388_length_1767_cov_95.692084_g285_i0.p1 GENE.NODE_388_length_1767_cov_95.692084_g285_i0~~NODE_388_length_1767_cov_95.692084_g285_i0.p1  ORF type:complete len:531 (+),score=90.42 NODE_388_length_1767_cov_95.692084_g285_i0:63-1655(+)